MNIMRKLLIFFVFYYNFIKNFSQNLLEKFNKEEVLLSEGNKESRVVYKSNSLQVII